MGCCGGDDKNENERARSSDERYYGKRRLIVHLEKNRNKFGLFESVGVVT